MDQPIVPMNQEMFHGHGSANMAQEMMDSRRDERGVMMKLVKVATAANNLFLKNCNVCTVYCDKQVEYETVVEQYKTVASTVDNRTLEDLFKTIETRSPSEIERYQQGLFDEESVIQQVRSRSLDEDDRS